MFFKTATERGERFGMTWKNFGRPSFFLRHHFLGNSESHANVVFHTCNNGQQ